MDELWGRRTERKNDRHLCTWEQSMRMVFWTKSTGFSPLMKLPVQENKCYKHQYSVRCYLDLCVSYVGYRTYLGTVRWCGCWGSTAHTGYRVSGVQVWGQLVCPDHLLSHGTSGGSCIQYRPWPENDSNTPKDTSGRRRMKRCKITRSWAARTDVESEG